MATLVLGLAGQAIGASIGGGILGISAATIGGAIGTMAGSVVDSWIVGSIQPDQRYEGARLDSLRVTSATEGTTIPRVFGRMRLGGNIIWATDFTEHVSTSTQGGGKGGGPKVTTTEYSYSASFAVALCQGPITGIGRIWADGELLDTSTATWRWYPGGEAQAADPFIAAKMGAEGAPAYRGTAYVVFEELDLTPFGNRIPQLSFEVLRPLADPDTAEGAIRAVTMIPGAGEFVYATEPVMRTEGAKTTPENAHAETTQADFLVSLDRLEALAPAVESVSLVVSWFGNDLRAGNCTIRPGVETATKTTTPQVWQVNGVNRAVAHLVSTDAEGRPVFGGTPNDKAVVQAIKELKARGYRVTFYPFILLDVPEGNTLPDPYSDNAATLGQPALPWRGRITCSPAAGFAGTVDKTGAAASQVAAFFGNARVSDFAVSGETVSWTGGADWGWRRMILHYAHLCAAAGGVDTFLIGSELRGLTTIRDGAATYPAVGQLQSLAADVRAVLGSSTKISYAADWSEYFGHQPADGSGDVFFHLDPLWTHAEIDFIGIDNYMPLSDWRDGFEHLDAQAGWPAIYDRAYLQANIEGGEGFDWFYASDADRSAQFRTPITDGAELFVAMTPARSFAETSGATLTDADFGGEATRKSDAAFSARVPLPANPTDGVLFERGGSGTGMLLCLRDGGTIFRYRVGQGSVTGPNAEAAFLDIPVSSMPFDGNEHELVWDVTLATGTIRLWCDGIPMGAASTTDGQLAAWAGSGSGSYGASGSGATNITGEPTTGWPVPCPNPLLMYDQPVMRQVPDAPWIFRPKDLRGWWSNSHHDRPGGNALLQPSDWVPQSKPIRFTEFGCPAIDRGTNQPNVFYDPKSSESAAPYFARGWRDDAIQRAYLEATALYWSDSANNPVYTVTGLPMVDTSECAAWSWDARPHPFFPALTDVWSDGANWKLGHWLTGRLGAVSLAALVRNLCLSAGMDAAHIDVSGLWGVVEGLVIPAIESPRATISMLARHFGFDAVESEGTIRFRMRGTAPVATITPDDLVAGNGEDIERTRGQETELPQVLRWSVARADEDYDSALVEARRITTGAVRVTAESFPVAVAPEEAERRCRRALMETWTGRERASFALPPSRLALDPGDVVIFSDGTATEFRLTRIADGIARRIEATRQDREVYDLPPGAQRAAAVTRSVPLGSPQVAILDLPQLTSAHTPPRPLIAIDADPWPGSVAVLRSPETSGWASFATITRRARIGTLAADLPAGPAWQWDRGSVLEIDLPWGQLESITDLQLFAGSNAFAVESAPGTWEILQARDVTLIAPGRYRLSTLLRGQRGTEAAIGNPAPAGAWVVVLDTAVTELPFTTGEIGLPWNLAVGPATRPVSDPSYTILTFTPSGASLRPFAPVHLGARSEPSGDITLSWTRRSRDPAADSWEATEVPLLDQPEALEIDILDGASVKRTLTAAISSVTYTAADQVADWGTALMPGTALTIRVVQLSAPLGRGTPAETTVTIA
ncbi:glycoside hydrolase TIM-barrel-like domain-containing protein [Mesobacterium sp. TK19101]|uniref:Glycoside hydrolase TIM-barrel-like domain-containing protein n=1 Tax=Mesobacterium hydrothermale TaxID=3111907 RepID=A0ABU6HE46_9RHOB|nr:glycoside hydrolase TIM-barrel-like domain-containing protein [Mesobacterium sp. TK19101]MEC3860140.1 glycoside hydrolase TIM-barrel-like domain-containing protein [Mesobacterium sp. TK19101]